MSPRHDLLNPLRVKSEFGADVRSAASGLSVVSTGDGHPTSDGLFGQRRECNRDRVNRIIVNSALRSELDHHTARRVAAWSLRLKAEKLFLQQPIRAGFGIAPWPT